MADPKHRPPDEAFPFVARFFALRTPLLPFHEFQRWGEALEAPHSPRETSTLGDALARDQVVLRARLRVLLDRPEVREALFVASPSLHESLEVWRREPDSAHGAKVERVLVRYLARMAGRATPFGLFAGCSVGDVGARTRLRLGALAEYRRHTRLDMDFVCALAEALSRAPELRPRLRYTPAADLYLSGGRLRYAASRVLDGLRTYHLRAVEPTPYLEATLTRARRGERPEVLARALTGAEADIPLSEAQEFIDALIEHQLLVSELQPVVTGPEPLPALVSCLRELPGEDSGLAESLSCVLDALERLDAGGVGAPAEPYREVARTLSALPAPVEPSRLFQVDLFKPAPGLTLGQNVIQELARGVRVLHRLAPTPWDDGLEGFRRAFEARYGTREVPLVEVLDAEGGIGFEGLATSESSPLLEGLAPRSEDPAATTRFGAREAWLLERWEETLSTGAQVLHLEERDLVRGEGKDRSPLPDGFSVMATVAAGSEEAIAADRFEVCLDFASGPSGAHLLGRFCHGDAELRRRVEAHLRAEEALRPDAVFAEVVHLPQGRLGNVIARPALREYELVYLGRSGAPVERQVPVTDLLVSIQGPRIVLRSKRLGREVLPRLTHAHNFSSERSLGPYRFLGSLQRQGVQGWLGWSWGPLNSARFLPRVVYGRCVLSLARWRLGRESLESLGSARGAERFTRVQTLRAERRLPRFVALEDGDHVLPVDLDNVLCVETFVHLVKERDTATLVELFPGPEALCVEGPEGRFVHEVIVPFVREQPAPEAARTGAASPPSISLPRRFLPGSEWLFLKLYTGAATVDRLLTEAVAPLVGSLLGAGAVDRWFFIRYGDPDWHLRLRLHGEPERMRRVIPEALMAALEPLEREGLFWKAQLDTYEREVERYGGPEALPLAEQLFQADSEAVLELLPWMCGDAGADLRWRLTLLGMDRLLSDLGMDLEERLAATTGGREVFAREFHSGALTERQLSERFREERGAIDALLEGSADEGSPLAFGLEVFRRRSEKLAPVMSGLRALHGEGRLHMPLLHLARSFLHMHANRMCRASARAQELVLHDLLVRTYRSRKGRERRGTRPAG
ncbi:lantibiotic dehydratase [Myxococcus sp. RHSTA-1-4]|uniref:lantibiotic dehydratase n=1 Tax=Myxococcus sp. RHSTA-1-4 TaxID=2874601 RepID=UPI001CBAEC04|nr:lantibiotic dehydratase [Myxococcus sp. RHSTA-1-4]MBZ4422190.1 lantibiotic dehydratase [Myxococcus sp. RHSTA-1-4]